MFGGDFIEIQLIGDTFDDCSQAAKEYAEELNLNFIPPFDDYRIIEGQGTVGVEILDEKNDIDYLFIPVGGGGLCAGVGSYFKTFHHTLQL
jgi:threonine dehydratase